MNNRKLQIMKAKYPSMEKHFFSGETKHRQDHICKPILPHKVGKIG